MVHDRSQRKVMQPLEMYVLTSESISVIGGGAYFNNDNNSYPIIMLNCNFFNTFSNFLIRTTHTLA